MSTEQNKALVRQMVEEVFNRGNIGWADEFVAPDFVEHEELPGLAPGREGWKQFQTVWHKAFPDHRATIDDMVAEGDKVVMRMTLRGTQRGEFMGVPPTGKSVSFEVIDIIRIAGGKCAEHWGKADVMGMMQQLGAMPAPGQGGH